MSWTTDTMHLLSFIPPPKIEMADFLNQCKKWLIFETDLFF